MALHSPTPYPPLSAAAEEVLATLERLVGAAAGSPGDPLPWLSVLMDEYRDVLLAPDVQPQLDTLRTMLARPEVGTGRFEPIVREEIAAQASARAGRDGRPIASSKDVVWAVLALVIRRMETGKGGDEPAVTAPPPVHAPGAGGGEAIPRPTDTLPASMAAEEMLEGLCAALKIEGDEAADALRWLDALLIRHGGLIGDEAGVDKLRELKRWGEARERSGRPIAGVGISQVRAAASESVREAGRPLITPHDVAMAIVRLALEAVARMASEPDDMAPEPPEVQATLEPAEEQAAPEAAEAADVRATPKAAADAPSPEYRRTRTFRLFVSSTFEDLTAERNALHAYVFPRLRELCREAECTFQAIDLRWGVSEQAGLDQQTMNICLREIERCHDVTPRPNFLVLLGDRYGWRPPPPQIPADEFQRLRKHVTDEELLCWEAEQSEEKRGWYRLDENADPPEYRLRRRTVDVSGCETREEEEAAREDEREKWKKTEKELHSALEEASRETSLFKDTAFKYWASATEQEITAGALQVENPENKVFCFFRQIEELPDDASRYRDVIEDDSGAGDGTTRPDAEAWKRLESLKDRLQKTVPNNVRKYEARWTEAGPTTDHIGTLPADLAACLELLEEPDPPDTLCVRVWTGLARTILDEIAHPTEVPTPEKEIHVRADEKLDAEGRAHWEFANGLLRFFVGREEPRQRIRDYLEQGGSRVLALAARGGSGKSALMARALKEAQENHNAEIVYRFIGATPGSTDGRTLLEGLCREIARRYGADAEVSYDFNELAKELKERLALATASRPLILFLDALDQLSHAHGARRLNWLPRGTELPDHVRVVVSTRREDKVRAEDEGFRLRPMDTYENLIRSQADEVTLDPMTRQEGGELLADWLKDAGREIQEVQRDEVMDSFEHSEGLPLYLKLAFEEARRWLSWDRLDELMPDGWEHDGVLAPGVEGIIRDNLFRRLAHERHHGQEMVSRTLGYLVASRYGLAEDEIVDLVSRDPELYASFLRASYHLPPDLLSRTAVYLRGDDAAQTAAESVADVTPEEIDAAEKRLKELREAKPEENGAGGDGAADAEQTEDDELVSLLARILPGGPRLPIVLWSRLYYDLEPYLTERQAETASLLAFYHRELGEVASGAYLADGREPELHSRMADYFRDRADPDGERTWEGRDVRGLSELPYHLTGAERWDDVFETLTDFRFLEHKAAEVGVVKPPEEEGETVYTGVYELQQDYELALAEMPGGEGAGADRRPLIVTATDFGDGLVVRCPWCNTSHPLPDDEEEREEKWLDQEIDCPNEECGGPLKVNSFVCERPSWV